MNLASAYPSPALPAWQLTLITLVAVGTLTVWLVSVFLAARAPRYDAGEVSAADQIPEAHGSGQEALDTGRTTA